MPRTIDALELSRRRVLTSLLLEYSSACSCGTSALMLYSSSHVAIDEARHADLQSEHAPLFIRFNDFFGEDACDDADVRKVYTRAPEPPFVQVTHDDGSQQKVWSSFTEEQVDIDVFSDEGRSFISDQVSALCPTCAPHHTHPLHLHTAIA